MGGLTGGSGSNDGGSGASGPQLVRDPWTNHGGWPPMEVAEQRHVGTYAHLCAQLIAESKDSGLVVLRQGERTWEAVREHVLAQEAREHAAGVGLFPHLWERMHVYVHEAPPGPPMVPD